MRLRPAHVREERGITGLETAIVLIAFVVVAAVFAFVVLSTGLFSSERGKETVYAGLAKTRGSMELTGGVIATSNTTKITTLTFDLTLAAGGDSVNLDPADTNNRTVISYIDDGTTRQQPRLTRRRSSPATTTSCSSRASCSRSPST